MIEVTVWLALAGGVISFLSPCVFPLVPAYLAQLTGTTVSDNKIIAERSLIFSRSIGFIIGFSLIFMILGASSTFIGELFAGNRKLFEQIGGIIIVVFGLQMMGIISIRALLSEKRIAVKPRMSTSFASSVLLGFLFGMGWSPCIGLALSSILILASDAGTMWKGMFLLAIYSLGLGVPFLLVSLIWSKSLDKLRKMNKWLPAIQKTGGAVMVVLGILLFTGHFNLLSSYLARYVPFGI